MSVPTTPKKMTHVTENWNQVATDLIQMRKISALMSTG